MLERLKTNLKDKKINTQRITKITIIIIILNSPFICDTDTLRTLMRKRAIRVVDVRKAEDYQQEHIPTAVSLPLAELLGKDTPSGISGYFGGLGYIG